jgi:hypothetical protein
MLNGRFTLLDIEDAENYIHHFLKRGHWLRNLPPHDYEDLTAYMLEELWILSTKYRPGPASFSTYAGNRLPRIVIQWQRNRKDTRYPSNTKYTTTSIHHLDGSHIEPSPDLPRDRSASELVRVLRTRSREHPRNHDSPRQAKTNAAA